MTEAPPGETTARPGTYGRILKSSALIGGSSVVNVLVSMIRVKFTAVYLGPLGVGLLGAYHSILAPIGTVASMGLGAGAVRQIAEGVGQGDQAKVSRALQTIRRASFITGTLGVILTCLLAYPASLYTFGNADHVWALCALSLTLLMGSLAGGLGAIIQGMRRIRDMAAQGIIGSVLGLVISVPLMIWLGVKSVVPMMLLSSLAALIVTWLFARRIQVPCVPLTWRQTWLEARPMLKLGIVMTASGLIGMGVNYIIRLILIRKLGLEANGIYSAASMLSSYYVNIILGAMGADFYPRLAEVNKNHPEVNRLVNEQTEVGLLIALPGVIATLTMAPLVIHIFYTSKFLPAVEVLQWMVLGVALRVVTWPMGYILLAKGAKRMFFWTELASNIVLVTLTVLAVYIWGLKGTGIAFFGLYLFYLALMLVVTNRMTGFSWTPYSRQLVLLFSATAALAFVIAWKIPFIWAAAIGASLATATGLCALSELTRLIGRNPIAVFWQKLRNNLPGIS
ncbi:O-antigen translocase [Fontisphaera persica]|uniref:O-antigen translocase n=1 Tax=Fontisphaera persica TaxID=2974023 RepID=UPI0024BFEEA4|nr:O-antigen translocase [Fontisphaera persica]WCJ61187.1 O-antigen translocase [Fontisphaera persica]